MIWIITVAVAVVIATAIYDLTQRQHSILRTFPILGHFRYWLEAVGPEIRQYIVTDNNEERPFSRDQRRWIYASAKRENNYFGFGSDNEMELQPSYLIIKHYTFPLEVPHPGDPAFDPQFRIPCAKVMGGTRGRPHAFRPASIVNVSGMSFGSLSGPAVEALNRGTQIAGCLQRTGEGGVSSHHLKGGDLVWQVGTAYFGCREPDGRFSMARLKDTIGRAPQIRAIEVKLSQGAKPGVGGCCRGRRSLLKSPRSVAFRWTAIASVRPRTAHSGTPTKCSISSSRSPPKQAFPSGSSPPWAIPRSGRTWRA